jgi:hypothetical protein
MEAFRPRAGRPLGITIIAVLMLITALFGLCGGITHFVGAPFAIFNSGLGGVFGNATQALFGILLAIANIILAGGLLNTARWAYYATLVIEILALVNGAAFGGIGVPRAFCGAYIIPLIVIIYMLVDSNVRRAFRL